MIIIHITSYVTYVKGEGEKSPPPHFLSLHLIPQFRTPPKIITPPTIITPPLSSHLTQLATLKFLNFLHTVFSIFLTQPLHLPFLEPCRVFTLRLEVKMSQTKCCFLQVETGNKHSMKKLRSGNHKNI